MNRLKTIALGVGALLALGLAARSSYAAPTASTDVPFRCPICGGDTSDFEALLAVQERIFLLVVLS